MAELVARLARDRGDVVGEGCVIDGVHAGGDTRAGLGLTRQLRDQLGVLAFQTDGRAIFAVERHVEHDMAELGAHLVLQLQALAHAHFHAAVVIADGNVLLPCLRSEQDSGGMGFGGGRRHAGRWATMNMRGKASSRLPSLRTGYSASMRFS